MGVGCWWCVWVGGCWGRCSDGKVEWGGKLYGGEGRVRSYTIMGRCNSWFWTAIYEQMPNLPARTLRFGESASGALVLGRIHLLMQSVSRDLIWRRSLDLLHR